MKTLQQIRQHMNRRFAWKSEPRTFADQEVILICDRMQVRVESATVLDWSTRRLRVRAKSPLCADDVVKVVTPTCELLARVLWVRQDEREIEAGLVITADSRFIA